MIDTYVHPEQLKWADVKAAHKKGSRTDKENCRPVSILPNISKIYERCLFKQLTKDFEDYFSKYQCGFRKGFSVANCLLPITEKWRESLDQGGAFGALLTDLSKALDCLPHDLLIIKLHAYGLDTKSLKLMLSYLTNRKQRVKIKDTYTLGQKFCLEFHKGLSLVLYYSTFLYVISFFFYQILIQQTMLMIIHPIQQTIILWIY